MSGTARYVEDYTLYLLLDGTRPMAGDLDMDNFDIVDPDNIYNVAAPMYLGGNVADPFMGLLIGGFGTSQIWPTGRTITSGFLPPMFDWVGADTFSAFNGIYPAFLSMNRTVTHTLQYNPAAQHYILNNTMTYQNQNAVAANFGATITILDAPTFTADGAGITGLAHLAFYSVPIFNQVNAGALLFTFLTSYYSSANVGAGTGITSFTHFWTVNPAGAGIISSEIAFYVDDFTLATNAYGLYGALTAGANKYFIFQVAGGAQNQFTGNLGFYGTAPVAQQTITGSRGGNVALANLLTGLANYGLIIDNTTV